MSATVHTGTGNFNYTNNTGGNVRFIIGVVMNSTTSGASQNNEAGVSMRFGPPGTPSCFSSQNGTNQTFRGFGKHILYGSTGPTNQGLQIKNISAYQSWGTWVDEGWLAPNETLDINAKNASYPIDFYNVVTLPE